MKKVIALVISLLVLIQFCNNAYTRKLINMKEIKEEYMTENFLTPDIWPEMVPLKDEINYLFPVNNENSVGVLDNKYISLIEFKDDKMQFKKLSKKHIGSGDPATYHISPIYYDDWIVFSASNAVNLFNIKTNELHYCIPISGFYSEIIRISFIPNQCFTILIEKQVYKMPDDDRELKIITYDQNEDFNEKVNLFQENRLARDFNVYAFRDNLLFDYNVHDSKFETFNLESLKPANHPLIEVLKSFEHRKIQLFSINFLLVHPTLPFALVMDLPDINDYTITRWWLVKWEESDYDKQITELPLLPFSVFKRGYDITPNPLEFSPDGKWLMYLDKLNDNYDYVVIPVDSCYENYLGKPVYLGTSMSHKNFCSSSWMNGSDNLVATDGYNIYKWDLRKR